MSVGAGAHAWIALALVVGCGKLADTTPATDALADPAATVSHEATPPHESGADATRPGSAPAVPEQGSPPTADWRSAHASSAPRPLPGPTLPVHSLAAWMRDAATPAFNSGDLESIAITFEEMIPWAPAGYSNWRSISDDGAAAARAGSIEGVKAACRGCHTQYSARYKAQFQSVPSP